MPPKSKVSLKSYVPLNPLSTDTFPVCISSEAKGFFAVITKTFAFVTLVIINFPSTASPEVNLKFKNSP